MSKYSVQIDDKTYTFKDRYIRAERLLKRATRLVDTDHFELKGYSRNEAVDLAEVDSLQTMKLG